MEKFKDEDRVWGVEKDALAAKALEVEFDYWSITMASNILANLEIEEEMEKYDFDHFSRYEVLDLIEKATKWVNLPKGWQYVRMTSTTGETVEGLINIEEK